MPRDGASIYNLPFPDVVTDTTIESLVYNGFTRDVAKDLNDPRPIVSGGTGATSADGALIALSGEKASQVVTNYDSHVWMPGSFYSATTASGEPVDGHAFSGIVYQADSNNIVVEARDSTDGKLYIRRKVAGVWGAWTPQASSISDLDAIYVNVAGDVMTGTLEVPTLVATGNVWSRTTATTGTYLFGNTGDKYLTYTGTDFVFAGGPVNAPTLVAHGAVWSEISATTGTYHFGTSGNKYLTYDSTNFTLAGGALIMAANNDIYAGNVTVDKTGTSGYLFFGSTGIKFLNFDGTNFNLSGGNFIGSGQVSATTALKTGNGVVYLNSASTRFIDASGADIAIWDPSIGTAFSIKSNGRVELCKGLSNKAGFGGAYSTYNFNVNWNGAAHYNAYLDSTYVGDFAYVSDYRIKKDVIDLPGMWDTVKALRPISYKHQQFSPPSHVKHIAEQGALAKKLEAEAKADGRKIEPQLLPGPMIVEDEADAERWGFIAHELQETLTPMAASSYKDAPDALQSPNITYVVAALTRALQEAMERIEALEAK